MKRVLFLLVLGGVCSTSLLARANTSAIGQAAVEQEAPAVEPSPAKDEDSEGGKTFLERFPHLSELVFDEPHAGYYIGFGLSPVSFVKDQVKVSLSLFEVHNIQRRFEWEILKINVGSSFGRPAIAASTDFTARTSLKWRWTEMFSLGPLVGYEFVSFPQIDSRTTKNTYETPVEPFSSRGLIYGFALNQNFKWNEHRFKLAQVIYKQTYPTDENGAGWRYVFEDPDISSEAEVLAPGTVFAFELSFLY